MRHRYGSRIKNHGDTDRIRVVILFNRAAQMVIVIKF